MERVRWNGTTDFGAPDVVPDLDAAPVRAKEAERAGALLLAAWEALDRAAAAAPAVLPKGPRGGGRDRDAIVAHVVAAERAYARKIGVRLPPRTDPAEVRDAVRDVLGSPSDGTPLVDRGWPARYAARRIAWHALDHAWEFEDKSS